MKKKNKFTSILKSGLFLPWNHDSAFKWRWIGGHMKKFTALFLFVTMITVFSNTTCYANDIYESTPQTLDQTLHYISNNIIYKTMNFEGENAYWKASLDVRYRFTEEGEMEQYNKVTLIPKLVL